MTNGKLAETCADARPVWDGWGLGEWLLVGSITIVVVFVLIWAVGLLASGIGDEIERRGY